MTTTVSTGRNRGAVCRVLPRITGVLWDAIDQHRLSPFDYFGIHDGLDLRDVPWRRGRGYDVVGMEKLYTGNDAWARTVLAQLSRHADPATMRALGFCVSIDHARFMARTFHAAGRSSCRRPEEVIDAEQPTPLPPSAAPPSPTSPPAASASSSPSTS